MTTVEYVVNELDGDGEIVDVNGYDTLAEARRNAAKIARSGKALTIEKVTRRWSFDGRMESSTEEDVRP